jgi:hypothetical protein
MTPLACLLFHEHKGVALVKLVNCDSLGALVGLLRAYPDQTKLFEGMFFKIARPPRIHQLGAEWEKLRCVALEKSKAYVRKTAASLSVKKDFGVIARFFMRLLVAADPKEMTWEAFAKKLYTARTRKEIPTLTEASFKDIGGKVDEIHALLSLLGTDDAREVGVPVNVTEVASPVLHVSYVDLVVTLSTLSQCQLSTERILDSFCSEGGELPKFVADLESSLLRLRSRVAEVEQWITVHTPKGNDHMTALVDATTAYKDMKQSRSPMLLPMVTVSRSLECFARYRTEFLVPKVQGIFRARLAGPFAKLGACLQDVHTKTALTAEVLNGIQQGGPVTLADWKAIRRCDEIKEMFSEFNVLEAMLKAFKPLEKELQITSTDQKTELDPGSKLQAVAVILGMCTLTQAMSRTPAENETRAGNCQAGQKFFMDRDLPVPAGLVDLLKKNQQ